MNNYELIISENVESNDTTEFSEIAHVGRKASMKY